MNILELQQQLNKLVESGVSEHTPVTMLIRPIEITEEHVPKHKLDEYQDVLETGIFELTSLELANSYFISKSGLDPKLSVSFHLAKTLILYADDSIVLDETDFCTK
ncbi:hypothetical protein AB7Z60_16340 [Proteus mirabilis]|uniref:hypothetical protein n=1 Tax=Morganellaceae TaxID=1903414 RepID=UPI00234A58FF|nr:hypothetical protein [Providencia sp. PROV271]